MAATGGSCWILNEQKSKRQNYYSPEFLFPPPLYFLHSLRPGQRQVLVCGNLHMRAANTYSRKALTHTQRRFIDMAGQQRSGNLKKKKKTVSQLEADWKCSIKRVARSPRTPPCMRTHTSASLVSHCAGPSRLHYSFSADIRWYAPHSFRRPAST